MTKIIWNDTGERFYETGVDRGVFYPSVGNGVPWNGLVSVMEGMDGGEPEPLYFDGIKYLDVLSGEDFKATIEAYSSPPEFAVCDGTVSLTAGLYVTHQPRVGFGFAYRTLIGNDVDGVDHGYKLHLVYNALATPASRTNQTLAKTAFAPTLKWDITTVPVYSATNKPTAHLIVDSRTAVPSMLADLENHLYGTPTSNPRLPTQAEVVSILSNVITEPLSEPI